MGPLLYNQQKAKEHLGLVRMKIIFLFMLLGFASMKTRSGEGNEPNRPRNRDARTTGQELRQTGPSAQKKHLVVLKVGIVTVMPSVPMVSSVDLTTAKTSMRMLTD